MRICKTCLILLTVSLALIFPLRNVYAEFDVERVIIVSIDSMNNEFVFNRYENPNFTLTPNIGVLVENGAAFTDAEAVMPTRARDLH